MNRLNHAIAMLTVVGGSTATAISSRAATLYGAFSDGASYTETFEIQTAGTPDTDAGYADFALSNDSMGNTVATVGDETTGFLYYITKGNAADSYFGTGLTGSSHGSSQTYSSFKPALYSSTDPAPVLNAGTYTGDFLGSYTLTLSATPEPEAWALLIAGAAMTGGALRASRRRVRAAA